jgi:hypothetical protein
MLTVTEKYTDHPRFSTMQALLYDLEQRQRFISDRAPKPAMQFINDIVAESRSAVLRAIARHLQEERKKW